MVLSRMPDAERSRATGSVMPTTPPLDAEYDAWPIWPSKAATLARLTMAPRQPSASGSLRLIAVAARRTTSKVPIRLIEITRVKAARSAAESNSPSRPMGRCAHPMPAELTTARSGAISAAALTAALIWSVLVTSTWAKTPPISAASASPLSACRSATTTTAPRAASRRAAAAPMPDAAPVTMALAPLISMAGTLAPGPWPSEGGGAAGDDDRRPGQQDAVVGGPGDGEGAAGHVDPVGDVLRGRA